MSFNTNISEDYGYNQFFSDEKFANINNWYIEIIDEQDDEMQIEKIPVENRVLMNNNKFHYKKINRLV